MVSWYQYAAVLTGTVRAYSDEGAAFADMLPISIGGTLEGAAATISRDPGNYALRIEGGTGTYHVEAHVEMTTDSVPDQYGIAIVVEPIESPSDVPDFDAYPPAQDYDYKQENSAPTVVFDLTADVVISVDSFVGIVMFAGYPDFTGNAEVDITTASWLEVSEP